MAGKVWYEVSLRIVQEKVGKLVNGRRCYEMKLRIVQRPEGPAVQSQFYE